MGQQNRQEATLKMSVMGGEKGGTVESREKGRRTEEDW